MKDNEVEIVLREEPKEEMSRSRAIDFTLNDGNHRFRDGLTSASIRSQALQSVIQQNEDLMARLKTLTLRSSELESEIESKDEEIRALRKNRDHLKEQTLILKEKESIFRERVEKDLRNASDLKEENEELLARLQKVERAFRRLFKYREKMRTQVPHFKLLKKKAHRISEVNDHLKVQVEELSSRLQVVHSEMSESQSLLIADYEERIEELEREKESLSKRASERDHFKSAKVEFENRNIEVERQLATMRENYGKESYALRIDLDHFRRQTKELLVQCETLKSQLSERQLEAHDVGERNAQLVDQVESLQILWKEKQEELERSLEKNRSLQKLNQDISLKLNESRREIAELRNKLDAEVEMLRRIRQANSQ